MQSIEKHGSTPHTSGRKRILAVDDDRNILDLLREMLTPEGFDVKIVESGVEAVELALGGGFDSIILDGILPDLPGVEVVRTLRSRGCTVPILMLTGVADTDFLVTALEAGADDFLAKPFHFRELIARLRALSRRARLAPSVDREGLRIDPLRSLLHVGDQRVSLTRLEVRILAELMKADGGFVPRAHLLTAVWGIDFEPRTNLLYTHIANIRRKLADVGLFDRIEVSRGQGYRLKVP